MSDFNGQDRNAEHMVNRGVRKATWALGLVVLSLVLLTGLMGGSGPVRAEGATISLSPTPLELNAGSTGFVDVMVGEFTSEGGLGAYNLAIQFDKSVVTVISIDEGDLPFAGGIPGVGNEGGGGPITNTDYNETGELRLLAFQATQKPGPKGNIRIASINFEAVGGFGDTSALTFAAVELVDAETGGFVPVTPTNGSVTIPEVLGGVSGKTTLQFRATTGERALVEISCPSLSSPLETVPAEDGSWQISGVPAETCELRATAPGYLNAEGPLAVGSEAVVVPANELLGGDANQSGNVDTVDISGVISKFGRSSVDCQVDGLVADVACDNDFVDTTDISATISNFGTGTQPFPTP